MPKEVAIIDDECDIVDVCKLALEQAGYEAVSLCDDMLHALQFIKTSHPQLVLLDLRMPQISGWTILDQLRRDPETSHIPVVLTTGMPEDSQEVSHALVVGQTELLVKPFDLDDLINEVEHMIGKP